MVLTVTLIWNEKKGEEETIIDPEKPLKISLLTI